MITCETPGQLREAVRYLAARGESYLLMGGGSNLLVSDAGFDGVVLRYASERPSIRRSAHEVTVAGSTALDALARDTVEQGLDGLMCCTGIPGTVGGAIVGNAGAWGRQVADRLVGVELMGGDGKTRIAAPGELGFAYRRSRLQEGGHIVVAARFALEPKPSEALREERVDILRERAERHPDLRVQPCNGSFFRNIEPTSAAGQRQAAGWFLERAGAKGMRVGGAKVFERHANIIVREPGCTAQDVYDLAQRMRAAVKAKFNIDLVREVRLLGAFRGAPPPPRARFY